MNVNRPRSPALNSPAPSATAAIEVNAMNGAPLPVDTAIEKLKAAVA